MKRQSAPMNSWYRRKSPLPPEKRRKLNEGQDKDNLKMYYAGNSRVNQQCNSSIGLKRKVLLNRFKKDLINGCGLKGGKRTVTQRNKKSFCSCVSFSSFWLRANRAPLFLCFFFTYRSFHPTNSIGQLGFTAHLDVRAGARRGTAGNFRFKAGKK